MNPQPRLLVTVAIGALLAASAVLPHVAVRDSGVPRSLLPGAIYFLNILANAFGPSVDAWQLSIGFNVTYLAMALQQFAIVLAAATFWVLAATEINRWLYRALIISGYLLVLSGTLAVVGFVVMGGAGVRVALGWAWLATLLAGVVIVVACRHSRHRIDRSWYVTRPELQ